MLWEAHEHPRLPEAPVPASPVHVAAAATSEPHGCSHGSQCWEGAFFFFSSSQHSSTCGSDPLPLTPSSLSKGTSGLFWIDEARRQPLTTECRVFFTSTAIWLVSYKCFCHHVPNSLSLLSLPCSPSSPPPVLSQPECVSSDPSCFVVRSTAKLGVWVAGVRVGGAAGTLLMLGWKVRPLWSAGGARRARRIWGQSLGSVCGQGISAMCCFFWFLKKRAGWTGLRCY